MIINIEKLLLEKCSEYSLFSAEICFYQMIKREYDLEQEEGEISFQFSDGVTPACWDTFTELFL